MACFVMDVVADLLKFGCCFGTFCVGKTSTSSKVHSVGGSCERTRHV